MNKIDQIRTVLNIAFMIGAVASVVLFFTNVDQTVFFYVCATSIIIKMVEYVLRFSIRNRQGGKP